MSGSNLVLKTGVETPPLKYRISTISISALLGVFERIHQTIAVGTPLIQKVEIQRIPENIKLFFSLIRFN